MLGVKVIWKEVAIMVWSTFWIAVSSVASIMGLSIIGFVAYQLWFNAWVKAQEIFTNDDFVNARTAVYVHFDDPQHPWPDTYSRDAKKVCRKMDEMAHLLPFLGERRMLRWLNHPIAKAWLLLKPTVDQERNTTHWEEKWKAFEKLGEKAVRRNPWVKDLRSKVLDQCADSKDS